MQVKCIYRNDLELGITDPLPELDGRRWIHRIYQGDVLSPVLGTLFGEQWFGPNWPKLVIRGWIDRGHFFAWRWPLINRAGYFGWKCYGVDAPEYRQWPYGVKDTDVYPGSLALCFTFRPFARMH